VNQVTHDSSGFDASRAEAGDLQAVPAIRMINADDETRLEQFGAHLSLRSRYQRFFSPRGFLPGEVRRLTNLDPGHEVALVATIEVAGQQRLVGVARYVIDSIDHSAEMAIVIADDWQSRGLGGSLLARLLQHAEQHGIHTLKGLLLATNLGMQRLAMRMGFTLTRVPGDGSILKMSRRLAQEH
jgi:acetyltransferase